tara:strand:+ start:5143 stop:5415 length:273 start_codon:yes stop_codon:yes gene_type:complete
MYYLITQKFLNIILSLLLNINIKRLKADEYLRGCSFPYKKTGAVKPVISPMSGQQFQFKEAVQGKVSLAFRDGLLGLLPGQLNVFFISLF